MLQNAGASGMSQDEMMKKLASSFKQNPAAANAVISGESNSIHAEVQKMSEDQEKLQQELQDKEKQIEAEQEQKLKLEEMLKNME